MDHWKDTAQMKDKGVTPGLVERAFRKSTWNSYTNRTSRQQAKAGYVDRETKLQKLATDLDGLNKTQAARPLKPPGRR